MAGIHTHYDNLKVTRNAPPEVIRAAYKTLSQKFHPDRNPGYPEATRIMATINISYAVLSDPDKRQEHDRWIALQEAMAAQPAQATGQPSATQKTAQAPQTKARARRVVSHVLEYWVLYGLAALAIWGSSTEKSHNPPPGPILYKAVPVPATTLESRFVPFNGTLDYVRPAKAPNGRPWPTSAGYVKGYPRLAKGLSTVTVDNSQNDSDVFVKLVSIDSTRAFPIRQFYIPASASFGVNHVAAGRYDIRYRNLGNGGLSRSEGFDLKEAPIYNEITQQSGTRFSNITMTLYKVRNGNMQTYELAESEF